MRGFAIIVPREGDFISVYADNQVQVEEPHPETETEKVETSDNQEEQRLIASKLKKQGIPPVVISECTGLSLEEINSLDLI